VIKAKYGIANLGSLTAKGSYSHGVSFCKSILAGLEHFKSLVYFELKDGSRILFWHDVRCWD